MEFNDTESSEFMIFDIQIKTIVAIQKKKDNQIKTCTCSIL